MKKFMLRVMPIVLVALMLVVGPIFARTPSEIANMANGEGITNVTGAASSVWSTVLTILQICAVAAIVFAGVKYMFSSADGKAEIKNGMIGLVIGAILVFAASTVVQFIINAGENVMNVQ